MAKGKKRKKERPRTSAPQEQPRGFDYGCLPYAMAVGAFEFANHLGAARVDGVAYGLAWSAAVSRSVPMISLVGQKGTELAKAFDMFNAWSEATDPDSLEMTFVFKKSGGYVLALSAEPSRLERRCLGFGRTHKPLVVSATWFRPIDSANPFLHQFRSYCTSPIAPFLFTGGVYDPRKGLSASSPPEMAEIDGLKPLLKFDITFVDEDDAVPNTTGWIALKVGTQPLSTTLNKAPRPKPEEVARERANMLRCHFPVTLERLRRSSSVSLLMRELVSDGARSWQIEQALCNLVLSAAMVSVPHYKGLGSRKKAEQGILRALRSRYELGDGTDLTTFSVKDVHTQIVADGNMLLRYLKSKSVASSLTDLQAALRSQSALNAPTALADPPAEWGASW
jgi:hypothetical protein